MQRVVAPPLLQPTPAEEIPISCRKPQNSGENTRKIKRRLMVGGVLVPACVGGREESERGRSGVVVGLWCLFVTWGFYIKEILYWYWGMGTVL